MRSMSMTVLLVAAVAAAAFAQEGRRPDRGRPPALPGADVEVYKTVGDVKLNMYIYKPDGHRPADRRAAAVFFFGGGWRSGSPAQFREHCKYLASRGMVAMAAEYRVLSRHGTPATACVADAKSAVRWIRANAPRLDVDPGRVVAGGGSAGGHIAACTATVPGFEEEGEDTSVSSVPDALVLFNPALALAPIDGRPSLNPDRVADLKSRMGTEPVNLSPFHHVSDRAPPTIIFHGTADTTVPYHTAEAFAEAMVKAGNRCELRGFEGQGHGFFNFGRGDGSAYRDTVRAMDEFLAGLGFLEGEPTDTSP